MVEVKNLVKRYGSTSAVDGLSFTVQAGQIYGFLGPNGAGKSTTMNIMTGYLGATDGAVIINGHNILEEPEAAKRQIGYLPEQPPLYGDMTVAEYLAFAAELKKLAPESREPAIREVMEMAKLSEVENRLIHNLSKGYRQRVGLAAALLGLPELLILDEPTVGLDPKQVTEFRALIRSLAGKHTIILSSHILSEVSAICDHVIILSHGKLVASDTPANLEKLMTRSRNLVMEIKGNSDAIEAALAPIEGVSACHVTTESDGITTLEVVTSGEEDCREDIFYACAAAHCPILELRHDKASLEDVFLELTAAGNEDAKEEMGA